MTAPLRAAVIGCGVIAYEHLPYLGNSARVELAAVCDRSAVLGATAAGRFGAKACFTDAAELFAAVKPDIVHVLTPPQTHDALVRDALDAGAHVICEKPMTGSANETAALLDHAVNRGRTLVESRNLLWNDPVMAIGKLAESGRLGRVVECDVLLSLDFLKGPFGDLNLSGPGVVLRGGAVHDFLPHLVYLFLALTGLEHADGAAIHGALLNRSGNARAGFDYLDALIDAGEVRGRLRIATDTQPDQFRIIVRGTDATAETDIYNPYLHVEGKPNTGKRAPLGQVRNGLSLARSGWATFRNKVQQHGPYHGMPRMLDAIYAAIGTGLAPPVTPAAMLATARLVDRLLDLGAPR